MTRQRRGLRAAGYRVRRRVGRQILLAAVTAALACVPSGLLVARPARLPPATLVRAVTAPTSTTVKYYVVKPPVNGQREYLYEIAVKTLGNGNRYLEIFNTNLGRPQSDGGRLTDPMQLRPGWILVLPDDAKGPEVRDGELALLFTPTPRPAGSDAPTEAGRSRSAQTSSPLADPIAVRFGAIGLMLLFAAVAAVVISGGRRGRARAPSAPNAPPSGRATDARSPAARPPTPSPVPPGPTERQRHPAVLRDPLSTAPPTVPPPAPARGGPATTNSPAAPTGHAEPPATGTPAGVAVPEFHAELASDDGPVTVSLIGVRPGGSGPGYAWSAPDQPSPPAVLPVILGQRARRQLHLDLLRAPDALTIVGPLDACRRLAQGLIGQLLSAGCDVAVLGDALGGAVPDGCRRLQALPTAPGPAWSPERPGVVVCAGDDVGEPGSLRSMLARPGGVTVPIVLGAVPAARWSLTIGDPVAR